MSEHTYIKGKDSDLESSIKFMREKLKDLDIQIQEVSALNPVPFVFSQHIHDKSCNLLFTNGKGASEKSCLASALGEYFERLSCNYFFADYYLGEEFANAEFVHYKNEKWFLSEDEEMPEGLLSEELWQYFDPLDELDALSLIDTNSGAQERGICALPFERQSDKEIIYFPVNIIGNIFVSNGMAAGNTKNEAKVQALCEIFERYVKNKIISEAITLPLIPNEVLQRFPSIKKAIDELQANGYALRVCDASLGGVFPVISVTIINPKDGSVLASFGAHPCFEVALERTVTELLQGRSLNMLNDFAQISFNLDAVADNDNLEAHFINSVGLLHYDFFKETPDYEFVDWNYEADTESEFTYLSQLSQDLEAEVFVAEYNHLGVNTCRILVPGISDIYPVEDLVWSNNNEGVFYREALLSLKNLEHQDMQNILQSLEDDEHSDMLKVAEFIGVIADEGSAWESLQIGELKAMLYLALGEHHNAKEWVVWCKHMAQLDAHRSNIYRCLDALLEISLEKKDLSQYKESLGLIYGVSCLEISLNIVEQKELFYGIFSPGLSLEGFVKHRSLLDSYAKIQDAKCLTY